MGVAPPLAEIPEGKVIIIATADFDDDKPGTREGNPNRRVAHPRRRFAKTQVFFRTDVVACAVEAQFHIFEDFFEGSLTAGACCVRVLLLECFPACENRVPVGGVFPEECVERVE